MSGNLRSHSFMLTISEPQQFPRQQPHHKEPFRGTKLREIYLSLAYPQQQQQQQLFLIVSCFHLFVCVLFRNENEPVSSWTSTPDKIITLLLVLQTRSKTCRRLRIIRILSHATERTTQTCAPSSGGWLGHRVTWTTTTRQIDAEWQKIDGATETGRNSATSWHWTHHGTQR